MTQVVDLNKEEVKLLLSGLHNLVLDTNLLDYITSVDAKAKNNIGNLISKFEDTFRS
jgi:hypothetical protein